MAEKMVIGLFSGGIDRLTQAGVILSGAAADDMEVEVYVHLQGARPFVKGNENLEEYNSEGLGKEFKENYEKLGSPSWLEFFEMAKEMTEVKVYICSLAGKIWGGEKMEDFIDIVDDIIGIGEYIDAVKEADVHFFI